MSDAPFASLPQLVEYYRHHSLASFNKRLDVRLQNAVSKVSSWVKGLVDEWFDRGIHVCMDRGHHFLTFSNRHLFPFILIKKKFT